MAADTQTNDGGNDEEGGDRVAELMDAIDQGVERAVRRLLDPQREPSVTDVLKLRDVVQEVLRERPHEVVVRWVDPCGENEGSSG